MAEIAITAANVRSGSGATVAPYTLAATVTQGQALYLLADGTVGLADSNGTSPANAFFGFATTAGVAGQQVLVCRNGGAYVSGGTLAIAPVYLGNTPGAITQTLGDLASGSTLIVIGAATSTTSNASIININPTTGGTT